MRISHKDAARLRVAAEAAEKSNCGQRLGAVLFSGGRMIARGHNTRRNVSMVTEPYSHAEHAEVSVLRQAKDSARGGTLYIVRLKAGGVYGNAGPCARCMSELIKARVGRVVYTDNSGKAISIRISTLDFEPYETAAKRVVTDRNGFYRNCYVPTS